MEVESKVPTLPPSLPQLSVSTFKTCMMRNRAVLAKEDCVRIGWHT